MRQGPAFPLKVALLACVWGFWWWAIQARLPAIADLAVIVGGALLVFPVAWVGRKILDRHRDLRGALWTTMFVQAGLGSLLGVSLMRALATHQAWPGWILPIPSAAGLVLVVITGVAALLCVANLALKGFGAPFFIALSRRLAADWLYAWTRNPMVLAALAFLLSLGIWFRSALFVAWVLLVFAPAMLFFVKEYEERELEIRFGESYLAYRSRTPMLFPRRPGG